MDIHGGGNEQRTNPKNCLRENIGRTEKKLSYVLSQERTHEDSHSHREIGYGETAEFSGAKDELHYHVGKDVGYDGRAKVEPRSKAPESYRVDDYGESEDDHRVGYGESGSQPGSLRPSPDTRSVSLLSSQGLSPASAFCALSQEPLRVRPLWTRSTSSSWTPPNPSTLFNSIIPDRGSVYMPLYATLLGRIRTWQPRKNRRLEG